MLTDIYGDCCFASSSQGSLLSSLSFALIGNASNLGRVRSVMQYVTLSTY